MAAENAIQNPLLDEVSLKGAKAVLVNITGGLDMTLLEVDEAANAISGQVDPEANIIFGAAFDASLDGIVRVSVVATGMDGASMAAIESLEEMKARTTRAPSEAPRQAAAPAREAEPVVAVAHPEPAPVQAVAPAAAKNDGMLFDAPIAPRPAVAVTPTVKKIVDPMATDGDDEPLFGPGLYPEDRRQKAGFLSLFGHGRKTAARPAPVRGGGGQGGADPLEDHDTEHFEQQEIPSFLRRLAN